MIVEFFAPAMGPDLAPIWPGEPVTVPDPHGRDLCRWGVARRHASDTTPEPDPETTDAPEPPPITPDPGETADAPAGETTDRRRRGR